MRYKYEVMGKAHNGVYSPIRRWTQPNYTQEKQIIMGIGIVVLLVFICGEVFLHNI
jgi:hypothetical protein